MLMMGEFAPPFLEVLYRQFPAAVRNGTGAASLSIGFTIPAGLPAAARCFFLCGWLQNATGPGVITFGGDTLDGDDELVAPNNPADVTTPVTAAYHQLNPSAGAKNLVLSGSTDFRSFCAGLWIINYVDPDQLIEADYQSNASASNPAINGSLDTEVRSYLLSLAVAQGFDTAPSAISGGFTERADGVPAGASSITTDIAYNFADQPASNGATYNSTVTFSSADGRGIVQLAVRGK